MQPLFNKEWFLRNQKSLITVLNTPVIGDAFRYILRIESKEKIIGILPHAIFWGKGNKIAGEFRSHNKYSKRMYYGFLPIWRVLHSFDTKIANPLVPYLNLGFDTTGDLFSSAGDGVASFLDGANYAAAHDAADANTVAAGAATETFAQNSFDSVTYDVSRAHFFFDTSVIPSNTTIDSAIFSLMCNGSKDSTTDDTLQTILSTSADPVTMASYNDFTLGNFVDAPPAISTFGTDVYKNMTFNATGRAGITKAGTTKLCTRLSGDISNTTPTTTAFVQGYFADEAGTTKDPKLVVTYTIVLGGERGYALFV